MAKRRDREKNWQFDSKPLKVRNLPDLFGFRMRATYRWKALKNNYNFDLGFISIKGLQKKLWASKVTRVPISGISGFPTWGS
jgi:hypothetical protein